MGTNSTQLDENFNTKCISCRRIVSGSDAELCVCCDRFVCKSCATYLRQGDPFYGWVCKKCYAQIKASKRKK